MTGLRRPCAVLAVLFFALPAGAQKTDKVHLLNGDHLTGEIKKMARGKLELKTDDMERLYIEWQKIAWIASGSNFRVEVQDGRVFDGSLEQPSSPGKLRVVGAQVLELAMDEVVVIETVKQSFWERLTGFFTLGLSYIKSTDVGQLTFSFQTAYRKRDDVYRLTGNSISSSQRSEKTRVKSDITFSYQRYLGDRWFFLATTGGETDEILGIDLRTSLAAQMGRYLVQSHDNDLSLRAGLRGNYENVDQGNDQGTAEVALSARYEVFRYSPDMTLFSELSAFPSLTDEDRLRIDFEARFRWELIEDLFWEFRYYTNYDSEPPSLGAETTNYGVITSMGYSF